MSIVDTPGRHAQTLRQELYYAWRRLRHAPVFTVIAVVTLGVAVAANTAIFSVVDRLVLRPLSYPDPDRLVDVEISPLAIDPSIRAMEPPDYFVLREQNRTLVDVGLYQATSSDHDVTVTGSGQPERLHAIAVTDGVLPLLGVQPVIGRVFARGDDAPAAPPTVILGYDLWQRRFGGSPATIGQLVTIDGVHRQIVGVLPRGFRLLDDRGADVILPLQLDRAAAFLGTFGYGGVARLRPGVTPAQAAADFARLVPRVLATFPPLRGSTLALFQNARLTPLVRPLRDLVVGDLGKRLWLLMAGIGLVLVIACANVANLLLVRSDARRGELTLRAALGATHGRIVAHLLSETLILAVFASVVGAGLAYAGLRGLVAAIPTGVPRPNEIGISLSAIAFNVGVAFATSLLAGLVPVLRLREQRATIAAAGRVSGMTRERHRAQRSLVAVQVALALVLLACSALMLRTFRALSRVDPGFSRPENVQTFRVAITPAVVSDNARVPLIEQQIRAQLAAIPGVQAVAFATSVPLDGDKRYDNIYAEDRVNQSAPPLRHFVFAAPGYLATLGVPMLAGRDLTPADFYGDRPVAVVSAGFARELWGSVAAAIGKRIQPSSHGEWCDVVGVAADVHDDGMDRPPRATVYWPARAANFGGAPLRVQRYVTFAIRTPRAGTAELLTAIRRAVATVDGGLAISDARTLGDLHARSMSRTTVTLLMLGIAGIMAVVLGGVGIYGVVAHSVSQRRNEIGIRLALGATPAAILRLIIGQGMHIVGLGLVVGVAASLVATRFMSSLIFGVGPNDPLTYAVAVPLLAFVGLVACALPATRAMRIAPATALRDR